MSEDIKEIVVRESTIKNLIYVICGQQVMLDSDLAELISKAEKELVLIDNYVDISTLNILAKIVAEILEKLK